MYTESIAKLTDRNPIHVETLMLEQHRTLNGLPRSEFVRFAKLADQMTEGQLEAAHKWHCGQ